MTLDANDLASALQRFPEGNACGYSCLTGRPAVRQDEGSLDGGRLFYFASPEEVSQVAQVVADAELQLGPHAAQTAWAVSTGPDTFNLANFAKAAEKAGTLWSDSPKQVLCLRLDFTPAMGTPFTRAEVMDLMATGSNVLHIMSYGKTWLVPTVTEQVLVLPNSKEYYDAGPSAPNDLATVARNLAAAAGYTLSDYDVFVYSFPGPWGGWAGGDGVCLRGVVGPDVIVHEFGHIYGVSHANYWRGQTGTGLVGHNQNSDGSAIEHFEYGDLYDIMGVSYGTPSWANRHMNVNLKAALNWLEPQDVMAARSNGVYRIHRFDHPDARSHAGEKVALRVRNRDGEEFWVSLREAFIPNPHLQQSACIAWTRYGPTSHDLIDTSPLSTVNQSFDADREDCALPVGESWTDPTGFLRIKNLSAGGTAPFDYLDIQITYFTNQPLFGLFTTTNLTMPGLVASFVNTSLRGYAPQNDWRGTQPICGSRINTSLSFPSNSWGLRASVGLTYGSDGNWDNFSVQWDGCIAVHRPMRLVTKSDDGSRLWIDLNHDGVFASSGTELIANGWGQGQRHYLWRHQRDDFTRRISPPHPIRGRRWR